MNYDVHLTFEGDPAIAAQWSGFAKKKSRLFGEFCQRNGQNSGVKWYALTPDVMLKVRFISGIQYAHIIAGCRGTDYGFVDSPTIGVDASWYLGDDPRMGDGPIYRLYGSAGTRRESRFVDNSVEQKALLKASLPSMYTGAMRRVMQMVQGLGIKRIQLRPDLWDSTLQEIKITPGYTKTHGLWIGATGARWIIEISASGIFRVPVQFCATLPEGWQQLHTNAEAAGGDKLHVILSSYWTPILIGWADKVQIGAAPACYANAETPLYNSCGWAFNAHGSSAVNISVRIDPDDPWAARLRASMYVVTITEAGGLPQSASSAVTESAELVNHFNDTDENQGPAIIQVADALAGERGYCKTFSCYPGIIGPRLFSINTPVFAYYDPSDALHVVRLTPVWEGSSSSETVAYADAIAAHLTTEEIRTGTLSLTESIYAADPLWPYPAAGYGSGVLGATWGTSSLTTLRTMRFSSPLVDPCAPGHVDDREDGSLQSYGSATIALPMFAMIEWDVTTTYYNRPETYYSADCRVASGDAAATLTSSATGVISKSDAYQEQVLAHQTLVLHGYDRTSYVVYNRKATYVTDRAISYSGANMAIPTGDPVYNGAYSGFADVPFTSDSFYGFSDNYNGGDSFTYERVTRGISEWPGLVVPLGSGFVTPPAGGGVADSEVTVYDGSKVVVGGTAHPLALTGDVMENVFLDDNFFYKAGGAVTGSRAFYQQQENVTPSTVVGVGAHTVADGHLTCFIGYF